MIPAYPEHSLVILYQPLDKNIKHFHCALLPSTRKKTKQNNTCLVFMKGFTTDPLPVCSFPYIPKKFLCGTSSTDKKQIMPGK